MASSSAIDLGPMKNVTTLPVCVLYFRPLSVTVWKPNRRAKASLFYSLLFLDARSSSLASSLDKLDKLDPLELLEPDKFPVEVMKRGASGAHCLHGFASALAGPQQKVGAQLAGQTGRHLSAGDLCVSVGARHRKAHKQRAAAELILDAWGRGKCTVLPATRRRS